MTTAQIERIESFFVKIGADTYAEPPSLKHIEITGDMMKHLWTICSLAGGARVLDVGCGQGVALKLFTARGLDATGITLSRTDLEVCQKLGYRVLEMDQSFLEFPDGHFDLLWCRHCLEHSIMPYYTLHEFHRVLKPQGWLYVEVPAPDTSCKHQTNKNHYSVLGKSTWRSLMERSGFDVREAVNIEFTVPAGPDKYWGFFCARSTGMASNSVRSGANNPQ